MLANSAVPGYHHAAPNLSPESHTYSKAANHGGMKRRQLAPDTPRKSATSCRHNIEQKDIDRMGFKEPSFADRQAAAQNAKKNILEKFKAKPGPDDPAVLKKAAERQAQAAARAEAQKQREAARVEKLARDAELAAQAAAEARRLQAEKETAEAELKAQQKAARDARYAARKAKK